MKYPSLGSFNKIQQRAKLLLARPDFQGDIRKLRRQFKIPLGGIKNETENTEWRRKFDQSNEDYYDTVWASHRPKLLKLRKEKKFIEERKLNKDLNNAAPLNALRIAIKSLLKEYKVPLSWEESVRRYLLFNDINNMWLPGGVTIKEEYDEDTHLKRLYIGIEDDTTRKELDAAWPIIKIHQKRLHSHQKDKFQPIKKFDRDKDAYDLRQTGKKLDEIATILSNKYKEIYGYTDIAGFIRRHKQKIGIN